MDINLEALGFTKDELQERVIESMCDRLLSGRIGSEDGDEPFADSKFKQKLDAAIKERLDAGIATVAEKHVLPNVAAQLETVMLQATNTWGEAKGQRITFVEYLTQRAEAYLTEKVDHNGAGKGEKDSYGWSGKQTRITYLVEKHLHYSIETAMKEAMTVATSTIAKGIHETVRLKLNEVAASLKVAVAVR